MDRDGGMVEVIAANPNHICVGSVMQSAVQRTGKPGCSASSYSVGGDDFISAKKVVPPWGGHGALVLVARYGLRVTGRDRQ